MGECKMRHVSGSAALPEGLRRCVSGFTRLRDREKRSIMNYPHWKGSGLKGSRMIAQGEALGALFQLEGTSTFAFSSTFY